VRRGTTSAPLRILEAFIFRKAAFVSKLFFATCTILFPLVGCTGVVGEDSSAFNGDAGTTAGGSSSVAGQSTGFGGSGSGSSGSSAGAGSVASFGSGGVNAGGGTTATGSSNGGTCALDVLPADVQTMLNNKCATCHGATPLAGLPSLMSYAALTAPSKTDPTKTNAALALVRIQANSMPMPPAPGAPVSASDIAAFQAFVTQGYPKPSCPTGAGGASGAGGSAGGGAGGSGLMDPLLAMPTCTSMTTWNNGNKGSGSMNPGVACIACHSSGEGPSFNIAGTVYPTGHEPDKCNSLVGPAGARIVIIGADGKMLTLTPNGAGNFYSSAAIKTPYQAKVTYQGRERLMQAMQTSGDCNSCHTQGGAKMAPGRITVP
jgi:hypothetical protein